MLTRTIIQMLKDQFKDCEDINQVTPVRVQGMHLIEQLTCLSLKIKSEDDKDSAIKDQTIECSLPN